jgi:hypothetical protein
MTSSHRVTTVLHRLLALGALASVLGASACQDPIEPSDGLGHACTQWDVNGHWTLRQSYGGDVEVDFTQVGTALSGTATSGSMTGQVQGTLVGAHASFSIGWSTGNTGRYDGTVTAGSLNGTAHDDTGASADVTGSGTATCDTPK